jgi:hypothetical protein
MRISDATQERMRQVWAASIPEPYRPGKRATPNGGCIICPMPADEMLHAFWRDLLAAIRE